MGQVVANISLGKVKYYAELPAANDALVVVLLKAAGLEADAALRDYDTLAAALAGSNDECDFTNYARKTITAPTITVDDAANTLDIELGDLVWAAAGGAVNNSIGKLVVCYDPDTTAGDDTTLVPLSFHDFVLTTDGSDFTAQEDPDGFYGAS